ncbi:alpha-L-fucosidase [Thozetella sp. PMI_491]|nr:alpha-L-fucosidase [Thozetella sp. PMI_491]
MDHESTMYNPAAQALHLHYNAPATAWSAALPVGNGRLGAMVHGRTGTELLQLNEDSVWYGGPQDRTPRDALRYLPELRRLIRTERHAEAENLVRRAFFATPHSMRHYEPLGKVELEFGHDSADPLQPNGYKRWLDLASATTSTLYQFCNGSGDLVQVRRDVVASFPDQVLLIRIAASEEIEFVTRLGRTSEVEWETNEFLDSIRASDRQIVLRATPGGRDSNQLCMALGVALEDETKGRVQAVGNCLVVTSSACIIAIGAQTTYRYENPEAEAVMNVTTALQQPWEVLLRRHIDDYQSLFNRVTLRMYPDVCAMATDERIATQRDAGLVALYHNYGRYLLISSSRDSGPKPLPATLQGIWNPSFAPPWGAKYTININLQMNYWPAAASNLTECALPMVDLLERMAERGRATAQTMYACRGWCAHHNTDIWADTDPQDRWMPSTLWPLGGVWVCIDAVEILKTKYDRALHARLAPILAGCAEFLLDFLVESLCGRYLVTSPSLSPENTFIDPSGARGIMCEGSVIDMTLVRWALELFLWSEARLPIDAVLGLRVGDALARLPPVQINDDGLIQEWGLKNYGEAEPGHRHVSHLLGLYPGRFLNTPVLRAASQRVLERRAAHGGGHTGWSRAWLLNLHARLQDSEGCEEHMDLLLKKSTMPNMLDDHPPFQIDGNFGGCAGILECLVQSEREGDVVTVRLLPACPRAWGMGRLHGVCVLGGWALSFDWEAGQVQGPVTVIDAGADALSMLIVFPDGKEIRRMAVRERLRVCDVQSSAAQQPLVEGFDEVPAVHDGPAADVAEKRLLLGQNLELGGREQLLRLGGQREGDDQQVEPGA